MSKKEFITPMEMAIGWVWLIGLAGGVVLGIYSAIDAGDWLGLPLGVVAGLFPALVINFVLAIGARVNQATDHFEGKPSREERKRAWEAAQTSDPS